MSSEDDPQPEPPDDDDPQAKQIARLEKDYQEAIKDRNTERVLWATVLTIIADCFIAAHVPTSGGMIVIFLLQIIALTIFARMNDVKEVVLVFDKLLSALGKRDVSD